MIRLRPYQHRTVDLLRDAFRRHRRVIGALPTGAGKTVIACRVIDGAVRMGRRVLVLAHRKELIDQMSGKLDESGIPHGVIMRAHPRADLSQPVQVASVQTLARRLESLSAPVASEYPLPWDRPFDFIVVDECHHTAAGTYRRILDAYPRARVLGLTATPYRLDGRGLDDCYDHLVVGTHVSDLLSEGHLVPARSYALPAPDALGRLRIRAGDFAVADASALLDRTGPLRELVETYRRLADGRLAVVFGCTVEHAQHIAAAYNEAGIPAAAIDGSTPGHERDEVLDRLRAGDLRVVCNVNLLTEGWDLPAIGCVQLARPTQSRALWRQMVGRGMRTWSGKDDCIILDHAGNAQRFGSPNSDDTYDLHAPRRTKRRRQASAASVCMHCRAVLAPRALSCHACGAVLRVDAERIKVREELSLEAYDDNPAESWGYWMFCLRTCRSAGKAAKKFQVHRGRWPDAWMKVAAGVYLQIHHRPPSDELRSYADRRKRELGLVCA